MITLAAVLVVVGSVPGGIVVNIDPAASSIYVELCAQGECDDDTSPLSGFLEIALDCLEDPSAMSLQDFDLNADEDLNFHLDYGFGGDIFATARGLGLFHAEPGPHHPFVPVVNGDFQLVDVPYLKRGVVEYEAVGLVCAILESMGLPCHDFVDLSEDPPDLSDAITGTITVANGVVALAVVMEIEAPLDPDNPELGTITVVAIMNGSAQLPLAGDLDIDEDVDLTDFDTFLECVNGPGNPPAPTCPPGVAADLDCDGDSDFADFAILQIDFTGP